MTKLYSNYNMERISPDGVNSNVMTDALLDFMYRGQPKSINDVLAARLQEHVDNGMGVREALAKILSNKRVGDFRVSAGVLYYAGKMPMTRLQALDMSIKKWKAIVAGGVYVEDGGEDTCGLCMLYLKDDCLKCPLPKHCHGTPYKRYIKGDFSAAADEVKFLEDVRDGTFPNVHEILEGQSGVIILEGKNRVICASEDWLKRNSGELGNYMIRRNWGYEALHLRSVDNGFVGYGTCFKDNAYIHVEGWRFSGCDKSVEQIQAQIEPQKTEGYTKVA